MSTIRKNKQMYNKQGYLTGYADNLVDKIRWPEVRRWESL
jgi:hypothetical protein